jgi:hypothetical protein
MRPKSLYISLAAAFFALTTRAADAFETRETRLQAIKTVGIISAVGDDMSFVRAGLVGLGDAGGRVSIAPWGLDDLIVQEVSSLLGARFRVQPVSYSRMAFAAVRESPIVPVNLLRRDPFKALVRSEVSPQGLDAYIVITRSRSNFGTGRSLEGIGLIEYRTLFASYVQIHALYEIRVISGKDGDVIEKRAASPLDNTAMMRIAGPNRSVDASLAAPTASDRLRAAIADLLTRSLPVTLADMHLSNTP